MHVIDMTDRELYKCFNIAVSDAIKDNITNENHYVLLLRKGDNTYIMGVYNNKEDAFEREEHLKEKTELIIVPKNNYEPIKI